MCVYACAAVFFVYVCVGVFVCVVCYICDFLLVCMRAGDEKTKGADESSKTSKFRTPPHFTSKFQKTETPEASS